VRRPAVGIRKLKNKLKKSTAPAAGAVRASEPGNHSTVSASALRFQDSVPIWDDNLIIFHKRELGDRLLLIIGI